MPDEWTARVDPDGGPVTVFVRIRARVTARHGARKTRRGAPGARADKLEEHSDEVGEQIEETRREWEAKEQDPSIPGAQPDPEESDQLPEEGPGEQVSDDHGGGRKGGRGERGPPGEEGTAPATRTPRAPTSSRSRSLSVHYSRRDGRRHTGTDQGGHRGFLRGRRPAATQPASLSGAEGLAAMIGGGLLPLLGPPKTVALTGRDSMTEQESSGSRRLRGARRRACDGHPASSTYSWPRRSTSSRSTSSGCSTRRPSSSRTTAPRTAPAALHFGDTVARDHHPDRIVLYQDTLERDFGYTR